ncbi:MAG: hypothetical protein BHV79_10785 [Bacteroides uniformis]|uniref:Uncharacterized protein n=1 Tax=Bacteroides uniformis TaxID=820 RepID=A0A1Q6HZX9_BACUN|nr:MAG: hypothetical protein BHV79_10785 [Bacteroides uniformis]
MDNSISSNATPLEQPEAVATARRCITIGLPHNTDASERRFPLTPEGVSRLIEKGYAVRIEHGAANSIHYSDNAYSRQGAELTDRHGALSCDIVINMSTLTPADIKKMRRGAMLLTLLCPDKIHADSIIEMQRMAIVGVAVNNIADERGNRPFADILAEIDGRAAIATASSLLADANAGKGILLGGIAGLNPCEVTVIGSGIAAIAASRSALGLGAIVRMFDDDVYSLRAAVRDLGPGVIASSLHERVLTSALRTADVVIATPMQSKLSIGTDTVEIMKKGVVTFDLDASHGRIFPSMPTIDLATVIDSNRTANDKRVCYVNAGSAVPRTAAMALSNTFITMLDSIITCEGLTNALKLTPGLRRGVFTFLGKVTDPQVAKTAGCRFTDINIFLQLS